MVALGAVLAAALAAAAGAVEALGARLLAAHAHVARLARTLAAHRTAQSVACSTKNTRSKQRHSNLAQPHPI